MWLFIQKRIKELKPLALHLNVLPFYAYRSSYGVKLILLEMSSYYFSHITYSKIGFLIGEKRKKTKNRQVLFLVTFLGLPPIDSQDDFN